MDGQDSTNALLQALLNRIDHLEYRVMKDQQSDMVDASDKLSELQSTVSKIQKARRAAAEEVETSRAPPATHRGPGALPAPAGPTAQMAEHAPLYTEGPAPGPPEPPTETTAASIHELNALELAVQASQAERLATGKDSPVIHSPGTADNASTASGTKRAFSNLLVKRRVAE